MIILDMGSGNTCKNDTTIIKKMIDAVKAVDTGKHAIVLKWQLFTSAPPNVPLDRWPFHYAVRYAQEKGYKTTASIFDEESFEYLTGHFSIPFVKIPCREKLYNFVNGQYKDFIISVPDRILYDNFPDLVKLCCIPKYPAKVEEYEKTFTKEQLKAGISDHTAGWDLFKKYKPVVFEKHFVLERDEGNPDAGPFAVTPDDLAGIL